MSLSLLCFHLKNWFSSRPCKGIVTPSCSGRSVESQKQVRDLNDPKNLTKGMEPMGTFNLRTRVEYREKKKPKTGNAILVGVIAGETMTGRGSESTREVVQLFEVFKEANKLKKLTTFVKTLESGKLFRQGSVIDFLSIGIEGAVANTIVATAVCHDLSVKRVHAYTTPKTPIPGSSIPKEVDSTFSVVTLDLSKSDKGFVSTRA
ncbi:MAG: hypothetical protein ABIU54_05130 [Candidatus Eisenbacteria bacterium]